MLGALYLLASMDLLFAQDTVIWVDGFLNSALPVLLGIFTVWFQKWYPKYYAASRKN